MILLSLPKHVTFDPGMPAELFAVAWLACGLGAMHIATKRGANGCIWFALGMLLGPFGVLLSFAAYSTREPCPYCRKKIPTGALRCPKCTSALAT